MDGEPLGPQIDTPLVSTQSQLEMIVNQLLGEKEKTPYALYVGDKEITEMLETSVLEQVCLASLISLISLSFFLSFISMMITYRFPLLRIGSLH